MSSKLHHAVVIARGDRTITARAFKTPQEADAFAAGVAAGVEVGSMWQPVTSYLLDERGSLAVSNEQLAAAKAAGWSRKED